MDLALSRLTVTRHWGADIEKPRETGGEIGPQPPAAIFGQFAIIWQQASLAKCLLIAAVSARANVPWAQGAEEAGAPTQRTLISARAATGRSACPAKSRARRSQINL